MEAMRLLLDERGLRPQVDFEAIVAANDELLLGALEVLQTREIRVPGDVAIAGFDDSMPGKTSTPPLTSVMVPYYETGYRAVETLLALIKGEPVSERTIVPSSLVVRQSCGCLDPTVAQAAMEPVEKKASSFKAAFTAERDNILTGMRQALDASVEGLASDWAERLLETFSTALKEETPAIFLREFDDILRQTTATRGDVAVWQNVVSAMYRQMLPCFGEQDVSIRHEAENLWQQARVMTGETAQRAQAYHGFRTEQQMQLLREIEQALIATFNVETLVGVLAEGLPRLDIPSCYLALYENPQSYQYPQPAPEWSRLMLAYNDEVNTTHSNNAQQPNDRMVLESGGRRVPSRQLGPPEIWTQDRAFSLVVESLYFQENQIGFVLFAVGPHKNGNVYAALRGEISSALKGALLLQEREEAKAKVEKAYAEVEQQVEQRTAELRREIAERERLQQEIIEIQQQVIRELSTPVIPVLEGVIVMPLIGNIDTMRARDITRALLAGISQHRARVVILDVTGMPLVDSGVANHLNKTIQAARLKGARTIVTGISEAVAETIVDLGIDWSRLETMSDLQTGLKAVLAGLKRGVNY
jgi:anti-anti-sigma regulatory factor